MVCISIRWAEGFIAWGLCCRLRHITSGRYLAVTNDNQVVTYHRSQATEDASSFILRQSKVSVHPKCVLSVSCVLCYYVYVCYVVMCMYVMLLCVWNNQVLGIELLTMESSDM